MLPKLCCVEACPVCGSTGAACQGRPLCRSQEAAGPELCGSCQPASLLDTALLGSFGSGTCPGTNELVACHSFTPSSSHCLNFTPPPSLGTPHPHPHPHPHPPRLAHQRTIDSICEREITLFFSLFSLVFHNSSRASSFSLSLSFFSFFLRHVHHKRQPEPFVRWCWPATISTTTPYPQFSEQTFTFALPAPVAISASTLRTAATTYPGSVPSSSLLDADFTDFQRRLRPKCRKTSTVAGAARPARPQTASSSSSPVATTGLPASQLSTAVLESTAYVATNEPATVEPASPQPAFT